MNLEIQFKKSRLIIGILFFFLMLVLSIFFILEPEIFIRNQFAKPIQIQSLGIIGMVYFSALIYSFLRLFSRKYALKITDDFLIDHSRYESIGKIEWQSIAEIKRIKKRSIELVLGEHVFQNREINGLKKFLLFMGNWNYKKSIIISSALLDLSIDDLFNKIQTTYKKSKRQ